MVLIIGNHGQVAFLTWTQPTRARNQWDTPLQSATATTPEVGSGTVTYPVVDGHQARHNVDVERKRIKVGEERKRASMLGSIVLGIIFIRSELKTHIDLI